MEYNKGDYSTRYISERRHFFLFFFQIFRLSRRYAQIKKKKKKNEITASSSLLIIEIVTNQTKAKNENSLGTNPAVRNSGSLTHRFNANTKIGLIKNVLD